MQFFVKLMAAAWMFLPSSPHEVKTRIENSIREEEIAQSSHDDSGAPSAARRLSRPLVIGPPDTLASCALNSLPPLKVGHRSSIVVFQSSEVGGLCPAEEPLRWATVACFEIFNFGSIALTTTFEQMRALHSQYFSVVHDAIRKHHGVLDKAMGDRLFGFWNVPRRRTQAELHAVQCALQVVASFQSASNPGPTPRFESEGSNLPINKPSLTGLVETPSVAGAFKPATLRVHVGVSTSPVRFGLLGNDSVRFFGVIGKAIGEARVVTNVASQILGVGVLITQQVARQVEHQITCVPAIVLRCAPAPPFADTSSPPCASPTSGPPSHQPDAIVPCYQPIRDVSQLTNSAQPLAGALPKEDEWMYQLHKADAPQERARAVFAEYCRHAREGVSMDDVPPLEEQQSTPAEITLWATIRRFPKGFQFPLAL